MNATPEISPPPPTGNNDSIYLRKLLQKLQTDSSLTCDNVLVIKGVNECVALFRHGGLLPLRSVIINAVNQADVRTVGTCCLYLGDRSGVGQADKGLDAVLCSCESHALSVISRTAGDNAPCLFPRRKAGISCNMRHEP